MTDLVPNSVAQRHSARLHSLIDEAQVFMDQLGTMGEQQSQAIESGDVVQILELVGSREPIVRGLVDVGEEIGAFIQDPDAINKVSVEQREDAMGRIAKIEHAMKRLRERDASDQVQMQAVRDQMAGQLSSMGTGQSALRAYSARTGTPNPILQDRQG